MLLILILTVAMVHGHEPKMLIRYQYNTFVDLLTSTNSIISSWNKGLIALVVPAGGALTWLYGQITNAADLVSQINARLLSIDNTISDVRGDTQVIRVDIHAMRGVVRKLSQTVDGIAGEVAAIDATTTATDAALALIHQQFTNLLTQFAPVASNVESISALMTETEMTISTMLRSVQAIQASTGYIDTNVADITAQTTELGADLVEILTNLASIVAALSELDFLQPMSNDLSLIYQAVDALLSDQNKILNAVADIARDVTAAFFEDTFVVSTRVRRVDVSGPIAVHNSDLGLDPLRVLVVDPVAKRRWHFSVDNITNSAAFKVQRIAL